MMAGNSTDKTFQWYDECLLRSSHILSVLPTAVRAPDNQKTRDKVVISLNTLYHDYESSSTFVQLLYEEVTSTCFILMTVEAEFFTMVASGGGGFLAGWGFGKLIKIVIKIVAIAAGAMIGVIMYLQSQEIVQVDWTKLQDLSAGAVTWISSFVGTDSIHSVAASVGISSTMALVPGFFFGFMKGVRG